MVPAVLGLFFLAIRNPKYVGWGLLEIPLRIADYFIDGKKKLTKTQIIYTQLGLFCLGIFLLMCFYIALSNPAKR